MNSFQFNLKFILSSKGKFLRNWKVTLPLFGTIIGSLIVCLTIAIMEGMEFEIFGKLEKFSPTKFENNNPIINEEFSNYLEENNIPFYYGGERNAILYNEQEFRVINARYIKEFENKYTSILSKFMKNIPHQLKSNQIIIGEGLSNKLNVHIGDTLKIMSPLDLNYLSSIPPSQEVEVIGIYQFNLFNYDHNTIFIPYGIGNKLFKTENNIYTNATEKQLKIFTINKNIDPLLTWENKYHDFISALKIEKMVFVSLGLLIILISAFASLSLSTLSVMSRTREIGILRTLGYSSRTIFKLFINLGIFVGFLGSLIGVILANVALFLDSKYHFIFKIFSDITFFEFPLILTLDITLIIVIITTVMMTVSNLYPAWKSSQLDILKAVNFRK